MKIWKILWITLLVLAVVVGTVACGDDPTDTTDPVDTDPVNIPDDTQPDDTAPDTTQPDTTEKEPDETEPPVDTTEAPHEHSWAPENTVAGTCVAEGYTVYKCACGETKQADATPKGDHTYVKSETAPTCTENGKIAYTCSVCNDRYEETGAAATGHIPMPGATGTVVKATCQTEGYTLRTCMICGEKSKTDIVPLTACTMTSIDVLRTCTEGGYILSRCTVCGRVSSEEAQPLGHILQTKFIPFGGTYSGGTVDCINGVYETFCKRGTCDYAVVERRLIGLDFNVADDTTFADYLSTVIGIGGFVKNDSNNAAGKIQNGVFTITKTQQSLTVPDFDLTGLASFRISFDAKVYDMTKDGRMLGFGRGSYGSVAAVYYFALGLDENNQIFVAKNTEKNETYTTYTMDSSKWHHIDLEVDMAKRTLTIYAGYYTDEARTKLEGYVEVGTYDDFFKADTADRGVELLSFSNGTGKTPTPIEFLDNYEVVVTSAACTDAHTIQNDVIAPTCETDGYTVSMCKKCGAATVTVDKDSNYGGHKMTTFVEVEDGVETWKCANEGCHNTETRKCVFGETQHADKTCTADGGDYQVCGNEGCGDIKWTKIDPAGHTLTVYQYDADGALGGTGVDGIPATVPAEKMIAGATSYEYSVCSECTFKEWRAVLTSLTFDNTVDPSTYTGSANYDAALATNPNDEQKKILMYFDEQPGITCWANAAGYNATLNKNALKLGYSQLFMWDDLDIFSKTPDHANYTVTFDMTINQKPASYKSVMFKQDGKNVTPIISFIDSGYWNNFPFVLALGQEDTNTTDKVATHELYLMSVKGRANKLSAAKAETGITLQLGVAYTFKLDIVSATNSVTVSYKEASASAYTVIDTITITRATTATSAIAIAQGNSSNGYSSVGNIFDNYKVTTKLAD